MRLLLRVVLAGVTCAMASTADAQFRFQGMDINSDGVITRAEWRGNDTAFRNQDWNQDGILSGEEVRAGGRRQHNWNQDWNRDGRVDNLDTQISERYRGYDMNGDNRVARSEWAGDARLFAGLDTNRDRYLSMEEYAQGGGFTLDAQGGPPSRPSNDDRNNDGWVTRSEWNLNPGNAVREFDRLDANRDNRISRYELDTVATGSNPEMPRSAAWRTGYDRGISEGRAAGREDQTRRQGWDLEGQRELERADSGYTFQVGTLSDYQAGYREGFRNAYRAGFTAAGGRPPLTPC
jgi:EF hand